MARFHRPVRSLALKMGLSDAEADDVVQETMVAFLESFRAGKYKREAGRLSHWLFGIAYRQAANARRHRARAKEAPVQASERTAFWHQVPEEAEATREWDAAWERARLETCLEKVRSEVAGTTFRAFEMLLRENRSVEDICLETGLSREAVYVAKHRVLKRLADLGREFDDTPPA